MKDFKHCGRNFTVTLYPGAQEVGMGAQAARSGHGQGGVDTMLACRVVGRRHDASRTKATDTTPALQRRLSALQRTHRTRPCRRAR
jgi:hypothetical protein